MESDLDDGARIRYYLDDVIRQLPTWVPPTYWLFCYPSRFARGELISRKGEFIRQEKRNVKVPPPTEGFSPLSKGSISRQPGALKIIGAHTN